MSTTQLDLKQIAVIVGIVGALAGSIGSWYVNSYRLDMIEEELEEMKVDRKLADEEILRKLIEVKCLVASVHEIPLPECQ